MISVALAAYKGEKYIAEQLGSILGQLSPDDEVIVSDDSPGGETEKTVRAFADRDSRVKYLPGKGDGVIANFENALQSCRGEIIFLSDQDDVWLSGKVDSVLTEINNGACLVLHDAIETDERLSVTGESFFSSRGSRTGVFHNVMKNSYMGCCMAFTRDVLTKALPFPKKIPMHDQWLGLVAEKTGKVVLLHKPLIYHRCHGGNLTGGKTSALQKLKWRLNVLLCLPKIKGRRAKAGVKK